MDSTTLTVNPSYQRIRSIDILRGAIMILMAIDHVRVYSGIPAGGVTAGIFFTRWITHFCAPTFVFLAGTAAFFNGVKTNNLKTLSIFLLTRGLLLVMLEITLIRFFWTFNLDFKSFFLAGVIWMLGWCMVLMSALVWLGPMVAGWTGFAIVLFQQVFGLVPGLLPDSVQAGFGKFWEFIYPAGFEPLAGVSILYVLVPWIGVMAAGYGFGLILQMDPEKRNRRCLQIGLSLIALFIVVGSTLVLQQPESGSGPPFLFKLLNQNKYPASQLFLAMTLGPVIALVPFAERARGWMADALSRVGRVPMFYYLLHILLIHISALLVTLLREGKIYSEWYRSAPFTFLPEEFRWGLPLLYGVFMVDVIILYFACSWYAGIKQRHPNGLLKYI